ncbi:Fucosyl transferase family protein, partial [Aphelenchoides avenae]
MASNLKTHRFVLAMENSVCEDYVTEKFFRIKQLIVPIVLRQKDYLHIAPKGSFIAADQF